MGEDARPNLEPVEKAVEHLEVNAVFGEPVKEGDVTVIPVAEVRFGYGYGSGRGRPGDDGSDEGSGGEAGRADGRLPKATYGSPPRG